MNQKLTDNNLFVEIERFFGGRLQNLSNQHRYIPSFSSEITLLSGPQQCGKTSLLFQYAYSYAKEGHSVLLIVDKKRFNPSNIPLFPEILQYNEPKSVDKSTTTDTTSVNNNNNVDDNNESMASGLNEQNHQPTLNYTLNYDVDDDIQMPDINSDDFHSIVIDKNPLFLKRIKIKYIQDDHELKNYLMEFPSLNLLPDLILIDDISHYFGPTLYDRSNVLAKIFAYLKETISFVNNQKILLGKNPFCKAILTDSNSQPQITTTNTVPAQPSISTAGSQHLHQPTIHSQQLKNDTGNTFSNTSHPKFLYAYQRWTNLILTIDYSNNSTQSQQQNTTATNINNNHDNHYFTLSILKSRESIKEFEINYKINVNSKTYKIESMSYLINNANDNDQNLNTNDS